MREELDFREIKSGKNVILIYNGFAITEIYDSIMNLILKAENEQTIRFLKKTISVDMGMSHIYENEKIDSIVSISEKGKKTILFDLDLKRKLLESMYEEACFEAYNCWIIEKVNGSIKAVYNTEGGLECKIEAEEHNLVVDAKNNCIKEIFLDGKCHKIYIEEKDEESGKFLLKCLYYSRAFEEIALIKEPVIEGVGKVARASVLIGTYKGVNRIIRIL